MIKDPILFTRDDARPNGWIVFADPHAQLRRVALGPASGEKIVVMRQDCVVRRIQWPSDIDGFDYAAISIRRVERICCVPEHCVHRERPYVLSTLIPLREGDALEFDTKPYTIFALEAHIGSSIATDPFDIFPADEDAFPPSSTTPITGVSSSTPTSGTSS